MEEYRLIRLAKLGANLTPEEWSQWRVVVEKSVNGITAEALKLHGTARLPLAEFHKDGVRHPNASIEFYPTHGEIRKYRLFLGADFTNTIITHAEFVEGIRLTFL